MSLSTHMCSIVLRPQLWSNGLGSRSRSEGLDKEDEKEDDQHCAWESSYRHPLPAVCKSNVWQKSYYAYFTVGEMKNFGHFPQRGVHTGVSVLDFSAKLIQHSKEGYFQNYRKISHWNVMFESLIVNFLHSLFVKFVGNVVAHVPDVAHAVRHQVHRLVLPPHHLLLLLHVHDEALPGRSGF